MKNRIFRFLIRYALLVRIVRKLKKFKVVNGLSHFLSQTPSAPLTIEPAEESEVIIMGRPVISKREWNLKKEVELSSRRQEILAYTKIAAQQRSRVVGEVTENANFEISVIVSIYRPGELFDSFLGNLAEQSIFSSVEIVLVLVDPIEAEIKLASLFANENANVFLEVIQSRITIYEAWNLAVKKSTAPLVTNMNIDDLRSFDSLEVQVSFMKSHPWVDVGYQDFYYLLDRELDWSSVVSVGAKSQLPAVTLTELAWFGINPPHNGPVWRRNLHNELGFFDEALRSAGDYEFWMRVSSSGRIFAKMPNSTVGYYINPDGMSTSVDSPSTNEERAVQDKYRSMISLGSKTLPDIKVDPSYITHPWDASEAITETVLNKLRDVR